MSQLGAAEESTGLHKRCLVPPTRQSGSTSPPSPAMETQAPRSPLPPLTASNLPVVHNVLGWEKPEVQHVPPELSVPLDGEWAKVRCRRRPAGPQPPRRGGRLLVIQ